MRKEWNVDLRLGSNLPHEIQEQLQTASEWKLPFDNEVRPDATQEQVLHGAIHAIQKICQRVGVPPVGLSLERFHIVFKGEFKERISRFAEAQTINGHVYIAERRDGPAPFARIASHELAHAASYLEIQVEQNEQWPEGTSWTRQLGTGFQPKASAKASSLQFNGLNEATTERIAMSVRRELSQEAYWDDAARAQLLGRPYYEPQVVVLEELIRFLAKKDGASEQEIESELLRDYFSGTFRFVQRANKTIKKAGAVLAEMDTSALSAGRAARQLGLSEAIERIQAIKQDSDQPDWNG